VQGSVSLSKCSGSPYGVAYDPSQNVVLVACHNLVVVNVSDPRNMSELGSTDVDTTYMDGPRAVCINASTSTAYIAAYHSHSLAVVSYVNTSYPTIIGGVIHSG
jgi:DNA-binding beta-propeller fold protein YncE